MFKKSKYKRSLHATDHYYLSVAAWNIQFSLISVVVNNFGLFFKQHKKREHIVCKNKYFIKLVLVSAIDVPIVVLKKYY